jgi:putative photosynthetic complex assembly protein
MAHAPTGDDAFEARRARERAMAPLFRAVAALVLASLVMVTVARLAGFEPTAAPDDSQPVVAERLIRITGAPDGSARVADADGVVFADLGPTEAGFINGVHRALERMRMLNAIEGDPPVRLVRFADGRLGLRDPSTGWRAELIGFGDTNRDAFLALLED